MEYTMQCTMGYHTQAIVSHHTPYLLSNHPSSADEPQSPGLAVERLSRRRRILRPPSVGGQSFGADQLSSYVQTFV